MPRRHGTESPTPLTCDDTSARLSSAAPRSASPGRDTDCVGVASTEAAVAVNAALFLAEAFSIYVAAAIKTAFEEEPAADHELALENLTALRALRRA